MIYLELLRTEIEKGFLKLNLAEVFKRKENVNKTLTEFEQVHLKELSDNVEDLISGQKDLEKGLLLSKRRIHEYKAWIDLFIEVVFETHGRLFQSLDLEKRKYKILEQLDQLIVRLAPLEPKILEMRKVRLSKNFDRELAKALEIIETLLRDSQLKRTFTLDETKLQKLLQNQELLFKTLAAFLHSQFGAWEKMVIKNGRGFLFSDPGRFPFSAIYTDQGNIYIILEVIGHLLGYGTGKLACRSVNLHTGEIFALIKSRTEFADLPDKKALEEKVEKNFVLVWRESEVLHHFLGVMGVLQVRERMAFELDRMKQLFLVEDYFSDGTLEHLLADRIKKKQALEFQEALPIGFQLLSALKSIHEKGYIHFDIKTENILIDLHNHKQCLVTIADFNAARAYHDQLSLLNLGHSTYWCPPEYAHYYLHEDKAAPPKPVGPLIFRFDVWSMGCVLYHLYFLEYLPWQGMGDDPTYQAISKLKHGWIPRKHKDHPYYPLISRMLEPDPKKRLTSSEALEEYMALSKKAAEGEKR